MMDRYVKWILLASLLVNAALVGFMVGNAGRGGFRGGPGMIINRALPGPNRDRSDQVTRDALREAFEAERPVMDKALQGLGEARGKSASIIRAETLDGTALDQSLTEMRTHSADALASFHRSISTAAAKLDAQHRAGLARLLDRAPQARRRNLTSGAGPGIEPGLLPGEARDVLILRTGQGDPPPGPPPGPPR